MLELPQAFIQKIRTMYPHTYESFLFSIAESPLTSIRYNPFKLSYSFENTKPIPWCDTGAILQHRPSFIIDPLWHAGAYYVQESSSMFLEQAIKYIKSNTKSPLLILDACAAPGGKSTLTLSHMSQHDLLVSNEIIKSRTHLLIENIQKWGQSNIIITQNDPSEIGKIQQLFDVIIVDAPCSGEGMFRKDRKAIKEWSEPHVELCAKRQSRILEDLLPALKPGGYLIYSTCTFNEQENEKQIKYWIENGFESIRLPILTEWNIEEVTSYEHKELYAYRFLPHLVSGEGFFMAMLKKPEGITNPYFIKTKREIPDKIKEPVLRSWLKNPDEFTFLYQQDHVSAIRHEHLVQYRTISSKLHIVYAGVDMGEWMRTQLIPSHALALSSELNTSDKINHLSLSDANCYLRKENVSVDLFQQTGWQLAAFKGLPLGWVKVLPNRVNNYFPTALRVLKQSPE